jgi:hypothetical protein
MTQLLLVLATLALVAGCQGYQPPGAGLTPVVIAVKRNA